MRLQIYTITNQATKVYLTESRAPKTIDILMREIDASAYRKPKTVFLSLKDYETVKKELGYTRETFSLFHGKTDREILRLKLQKSELKTRWKIKAEKNPLKEFNFLPSAAFYSSKVNNTAYLVFRALKWQIIIKKVCI